MNLRIRSGQLRDVQELAELKEISARRAYAFATPEDLDAWLAARGGTAPLRRRIQDPDGGLIVAVDETGALAGMVVVRVDDDVAHLGDLYCRHDGMGVGSVLYNVAKERARERGVHRIVAHCFRDNIRAQRFFVARGWRIVKSVEPSDRLGTSMLDELELRT